MPVDYLDELIDKMKDLPFYLSFKMISRLTGLRYSFLQNCCLNKALRATKVNGEWKISKDELISFLSEMCNWLIDIKRLIKKGVKENDENSLYRRWYHVNG